MKNCAIGIIFSEDKTQVLAIKRCDVPIWVFPGGGIEDGETPESTLIREIQEETGVSVEITRKVAEYTPLNNLTRFTHLYECRICQGTPNTGEETRAIGFFDVDKLPYPFLPVHQHWLDDTLKGSAEIIRKPIHGTRWRDFAKAFLAHPLLSLRYIFARLGIALNSAPEKPPE